MHTPIRFFLNFVVKTAFHTKQHFISFVLKIIIKYGKMS